MLPPLNIPYVYPDLAKPKRRNKTLANKISQIKLLRASGMHPFEIAKNVLMGRSLVPWQCKIGPEQRECIEFADELRKLTLSGEYKGIWGHQPNEGKRHPLVAIILHAMGMIPGATDYFFMGEWGHGVIEFKMPGNGLQETQQLYRDWCTYNGVYHAIAHSKQQGIDLLRAWGALV